MIIVPLGVSSATPTVNRNLPSVALWRDGQVFLFDCGENTQTRMLQAGLKRSKIDYIFISHLDGDHYFGLLGLLSTLNLQRHQSDLTIVGPMGIKKFVEFNIKHADIAPSFNIKYVELKEGFEREIVADEPDLFIEAMPLEHTKFCIGYRLQEKDKPGKVDAEKAKSLGIVEDTHFKQLKSGEDVTLPDGTVVKSSDIVGEPRKGNSFAYVTDTVYCDNAVELSKEATILYHEATFGQALKDKADETGHSTAEGAATVASNADAKLLVIGHFSGRYTNEFVLMKEARKIFKDTWLATELRPIMTDPEHEKGIITANIEEQKSSDNTRRSSGRSSNFKSRKPRERRKKIHKRAVVGSSNPGKFSEYYRRNDHHNHNQDRDHRDRRDNRDYRGRHNDHGHDNNRRDYNRDSRDNRGWDNRNRDNRNRDNRDNRNRDNRHRDNRNRDNRNRDNRNNNRDRSNDTPKYKPITPRTPFDEFNRF